MFKYHRHCRSFTLIELSIVLSVLSLFVIMTISGASIINNANALRIIKQISNYREAIGRFYKTYGALPGDYYNAQYKFAPSGYTKISLRDLSTLNKDILDKIPLNGSSDGIVEANIKSELSFHYSEAYGVWSHLGASGLIDNKYSNTCYDISSSDRRKCSKTGYNLPKIQGGYNENSSFVFYSSLLEINDVRLYGAIIDQIKTGEIKSYNMLLLTDVSRNYVYNSSVALDDHIAFGAGGAVSSDIMMKIDTKIDDGRPFTGKVFGVNGGKKDNQKNGDFEEGQCNTYKGDNSQFNSGERRESIIYTNQNNKSCVGIILFDEFNS